MINEKELIASRIGVWDGSTFIPNIPDTYTISGLPTTDVFDEQVGYKTYELSNHLGNVLATITDRKVPDIDIPNNIYNYYNPQITTITDYYPFGMQIEERSWVASSSSYRFGFNGMEKDDGIKGTGNSLDFGARIYDSRLGRWMSTDPMFNTQPDWSPYKAFYDNPNYWIDPDGMTEDERLKAMKKIKSLIGTPYSALDCSALVNKAAMAAGKPSLNTENLNGVGNIATNSRKVNYSDLRIGDFVTFKSTRTNHKGPNGMYDHIGMVTETSIDKDGNVTDFKFIHASSSKGAIETYFDLKKGLSYLWLSGAYQWDTPSPEDNITAFNNSPAMSWVKFLAQNKGGEKKITPERMQLMRNALVAAKEIFEANFGVEKTPVSTQSQETTAEQTKKMISTVSLEAIKPDLKVNTSFEIKRPEISK